MKKIQDQEFFSKFLHDSVEKYRTPTLDRTFHLNSRRH